MADSNNANFVELAQQISSAYNQAETNSDYQDLTQDLSREGFTNSWGTYRALTTLTSMYEEQDPLNPLSKWIDSRRNEEEKVQSRKMGI